MANKIIELQEQLATHVRKAQTPLHPSNSLEQKAQFTTLSAANKVKLFKNKPNKVEVRKTELSNGY